MQLKERGRKRERGREREREKEREGEGEREGEKERGRGEKVGRGISEGSCCLTLVSMSLVIYGINGDCSNPQDTNLHKIHPLT